MELDAATHTGVDDVRDLQELLRFRPSRDRFRVVIVDEVHMLSKAAFNALLKSIEEPPPYVLWVFATTDGETGFYPHAHVPIRGPGDLHALAELMYDAGFNVYVLRLPDYGTPGHTISEVSWESALHQVQQCYRLLNRGGGKVHVAWAEATARGPRPRLRFNPTPASPKP